MNNLIRGFSGFFRAFPFIFKHRLHYWYIVPFILWLILVFGLAVWISGFVKPLLDHWIEYIPGMKGQESGEGFWSIIRSWLKTGLQFAVIISMKILIWYFISRLMKYVVLIITSPLLAYLSEVTSEIISAKKYAFNGIQLAKDTLRGIIITLRNLCLEMLLIAAGMLLSFFIPFIAPLMALFLYLGSSYFMGFTLFDYYAERQKMSIGQSVAYMRRNLGVVVGLGLAYNLCSMFFLLDWVVAPINGAIAASMLAEEG